MTTTAVDILTKTRELLSDPTKWTKGQYATTPEGLAVNPTDHDASCFCLLGAIRRVAPGHEHVLERFEAKTLLENHLPNHIAGFNDHPDTTHQDVLNVLDKAIASHPHEQH